MTDEKQSKILFRPDAAAPLDHDKIPSNWKMMENGTSSSLPD